jgi:ribosomal protein S15P/S13E
MVIIGLMENKMNIVVDLMKYYDWESTTETPTKEDAQALKYKPSQDGKWLKKALKDKPSHTEIHIPEQQIKTMAEHYERTGTPKAREKIAAWLLEEKIMPHHAHPDHFVKIHVSEEPATEAFLNQYFGLDKPKAAPVVVAPVSAPDPVVAPEAVKKP